MVQTKEGCLAFLAEARAALDELSVITDREHQLQADEERLEKTLEAEQKAVADAIRTTIKKRMDELNASYDKEISKSQDRLKKIRAKREKAKNQGMKDRIEEETSALRDHNRELRLKMKSLFQQKRVPRYCRSALYYCLYFPRGLREYLVLLAAVLLFFLAVPYGIYYQIPVRQPLYLAVIYLADILLVGGGYLAVGNRGKLHHLDALKEGRAIRDAIRSNDKKIRVITSTIKKDRNESLYNLEKYDDEIAQAEQELAQITDQKKEAVATFETVTKNILADEIEHNNQERLDELQARYRETEEALRQTEAEAKEKGLYITDHYGTYLGREYLDSLKIAELVQLIQNDQAKNLSEALEMHQNGRTQLASVKPQ